MILKQCEYKSFFFVELIVICSTLSVVTGANRGIGLSIVKQLLKQSVPGTLIIGVDLADEQLKHLRSSSPDKFDYVTGDISQRSTSEKAVALAKERSGRLDALVLNAGILRPVGLVADISVDEMKKLFDVNFFALFHTVSGIVLC